MRSYKDFNEFKILTSLELGDAISLRSEGSSEVRNAIITAYTDNTITFGTEVFKFEDLKTMEYRDYTGLSWKHLAVDTEDEPQINTFEVGKTYLDGIRERIVSFRHTIDDKNYVVFNNSEVGRVYRTESEERARLATGEIVKATWCAPQHPETFSAEERYWLKNTEGVTVGTVEILSKFSEAGEDFVSCKISTSNFSRTIDKQKINTEYNESFRYGDFLCSSKFIIEG